MKKIFLYIYIIIFLAVCLTPSVLTLFGVKSVNYERRDLAPEPKLFNNGINTHFTEDFDAYFSDNFALRPYLVTAYSNIVKTVFHTSASENVVIGQDDFLYYILTVNDHTRKNAMTDKNIDLICQRLKAAQDKLNEAGIAFFFISPPDKVTIYPEYMPKRYPDPNIDSNMTRIYEKMDEYGIQYVDVRDELTAAKSVRLPYFKTDTHWNNYGALIAYNEMMEKTQELLPEMTYRDFSAVPNEEADNFNGVLTSMLFPASEILDTQIEYDFDKTFTSERPIVDKNAIEIKTTNEAANMDALIFRDSFFIFQVDFFSESFHTVEYNRTTPYDFDYAIEQDVDIVILEICEWNLQDLIIHVQ